MPNFAISDMASITLPIDPLTTFLEVEAIEGGISVSRKVSADDLGIGAGVVSVVGGVNIDVDSTDPMNPIVNMPAAILGVDVNGVTLNAVGAATSYLDETGAYSVPAGGGGGGACISTPVIDPANHTLDADDAEETSICVAFTTYDITCPNTADLSFPVGASHDVYLRGAFGRVFRGDGAMFFLDGASSVDLADITFTIGGFYTIFRESAANFIITGAGNL